jgi:hypothetical protein
MLTFANISGFLRFAAPFYRVGKLPSPVFIAFYRYYRDKAGPVKAWYQGPKRNGTRKTEPEPINRPRPRTLEHFDRSQDPPFPFL